MRTIGGDIPRRMARLGGWAALTGVFLLCRLAGAARAGNVSYVYDQGDRLLAAFDGNGNYANYQYDKAGNITAIVKGGTSGVAVFGYSPDHGLGGTQVTIYGLNFSPTASQNTVQFGSTAATVISATATTIVATMPGGSQVSTSPVTVTSPSGAATGPVFFVP